MSERWGSDKIKRGPAKVTLPLAQIYTYCVKADARCGYIITDKELVVTRFKPKPPSESRALQGMQTPSDDIPADRAAKSSMLVQIHFLEQQLNQATQRLQSDDAESQPLVAAHPRRREVVDRGRVSTFAGYYDLGHWSSWRRWCPYRLCPLAVGRSDASALELSR